VALPAGAFGILFFGGVHSDADGQWFQPPLVMASFALLSAPLWVGIAVWRRLHRPSTPNR
jgi:hypothetical protein